MPRIAIWTNALPWEQPLDRVIDGAIIAFLLFSVFSITIAEAAILLAIAAWTVKLVLSRGKGQLHLPLLLPVAGFFLASALATITAVDPYRSLRELRNVFQPALFFLLVNHIAREERATTLTYLLIAITTVAALYGLSQSWVQGSGFRIRGTMSIWMTFAGILMLIDVLTLAYLLFNASDWRSYWVIPSLILLTTALVMTHTRGAWLGLAAGVAMIVWFRKKMFVVVLPVIAVATFMIVPPAVKERVRSIADMEDITAKERIYMWASGVQIIRDYPWTGVGMEGVKQVYPLYQDPQASGRRWGHLHNNVIQVAVERGLIGLAFWLWIWVAFYRDAWRIYGNLSDRAVRAKALVVGSLAGVTAFHLEGLFEYTFGDSEVIMLVYFLMALPYLTLDSGVNRPPSPAPDGTAADERRARYLEDVMG